MRQVSGNVIMKDLTPYVIYVIWKCDNERPDRMRVCVYGYGFASVE